MNYNQWLSEIIIEIPKSWRHLMLMMMRWMSAQVCGKIEIEKSNLAIYISERHSWHQTFLIDPLIKEMKKILNSKDNLYYCMKKERSEMPIKVHEFVRSDLQSSFAKIQYLATCFISYIIRSLTAAWHLNRTFSEENLVFLHVDFHAI